MLGVSVNRGPLVRPQNAHPCGSGLSRRDFLISIMAAGAGTACGSSSEPPGTAGAPASAEPFPRGIETYAEDYRNWTRELDIAGLRTFAPRTPEDVVAAANWAARNGHQLRARGMRHNWSPLTVSFNTTAVSPLVVADTTAFLNRVEMVTDSEQPAVRAEAGILMEDLLDFLQQHGFGFTAVPAVGDVTLGGVLAINGHGCAIPAVDEAPLAQQSYGSMSNRVLSLLAVVWDGGLGQYALRRFERNDPQIGALLAHLGRAFIVEATLAVEPNQNLRCQSYIGIAASELFAPPGSGGRDIASFLDSAGRIESIWYPFTERPWLKVWSVAPQKPPGSRAVTRPYNYAFSDNLPRAVTDLAQALVSGQPQLAPLFGKTIYEATLAGLVATLSLDLWGPSKDLLLFIKPTTLRIHELSYVVLTSRGNVQQVLSDFTAEYLSRLQAYRDQGRFPVNMPVEYRVTGLDRAPDIGAVSAQEAMLSAIVPRPDHPEWDTAVWLSLLTIPTTPDMYAFFRDIEQWMLGHFVGSDAALRPEWSKGWAYTQTAAWEDGAVLGQTIPGLLRAGRPADANWDAALQTLRDLDPANIYRNDFLDRLMPAS